MTINSFVRKGDTFLELETIGRLRTAGLLVDADKGGFLCAPSHEQGGVTVLGLNLIDYKIIVEVEGGEFILNPLASKLYADELRLINEYKTGLDEYQPYTPPITIDVLDLMPTRFGTKWLIVSSPQFVVNRAATQKDIERLQQMNSDTWTKYVTGQY